MKIRMKGNSVRLRVGRSELARFLVDGRIEETIRFAPEPDARFTYALEMSSVSSGRATVRYVPGALIVLVTSEQVSLWRNEDQVGIYTQVDFGPEEALEIIVEKDFACLDGNDPEDADTFANPVLAANCQVA